MYRIVTNSGDVLFDIDADFITDDVVEIMTIKVGDYFWEYNNGVGYRRKTHSEEHIKYFWEGYMTRAFFTVDELLSVYPSAIID